MLILLYTAEKRAYLGFIPNDQNAFVDRLRKVIQQQKSTQLQRQGQVKQKSFFLDHVVIHVMCQPGAAGPSMNPQSGPQQLCGTPPQMAGSNTPTSQTTTQSLMMSQTNTMAMGGGQITQNVVTSIGQSGPGIGNVLGQPVNTGGMQPRLRMQVSSA